MPARAGAVIRPRPRWPSDEVGALAVGIASMFICLSFMELASTGMSGATITVRASLITLGGRHLVNGPTAHEARMSRELVRDTARFSAGRGGGVLSEELPGTAVPLANVVRTQPDHERPCVSCEFGLFVAAIEQA